MSSAHLRDFYKKKKLVLICKFGIRLLLCVSGCCCYLRAEWTTSGGLLEMQNLGPHSRTAKLKSAFLQDPQVICLYFDILEALF